MVQDVQNQIHLEYTQKCRKILIGSMQVCLISIHVVGTLILRNLMEKMLFFVTLNMMINDEDDKDLLGPRLN